MVVHGKNRDKRKQEESDMLFASIVITGILGSLLAYYMNKLSNVR